MPKEPLGVITCHFNPCWYWRPVQNLLRFERLVQGSGARLLTAELFFQKDSISSVVAVDCYSRVAAIKAPRYSSTLWQKEAMLNELIRRHADEFEALAWVDADVIFLRDDWVKATIKELEHFPVVQMFSQAHLLDKDSEISSTVRSVGWHYSTDNECWKDFSVSHPGFAWAAKSDLLKRNRLYPFMVTGCGDSAMLRGFTCDDSPEFDASIGPACASSVAQWGKGWRDDIKGEMGFVMGAVAHMYHGSLSRRQNSERRYWMREVDPALDLVENGGYVSWTEHAMRNKPRLVQGVQDYFASRFEDD